MIGLRDKLPKVAEFAELMNRGLKVGVWTMTIHIVQKHPVVENAFVGFYVHLVILLLE